MNSPHPHPRPGQIAKEMLLFAFAYLVYFGVRGMTEGAPDAAIDNARRVMNLERLLHMNWEPWLQRMIIDHHALVTVMNWVYIWGHWPLIIGVGGWLLWTCPEQYRLIRNAFLISGGIGLIIFATFPVAPPRLATGDVVDTVTRYSDAYRVLQPPAFVNQYAAVPSLHFGWNLLIGIMLVQVARRRAVQAFGVVMPLAMGSAVVLTANHYVFDMLAGAAVALLGLLIAEQIEHALHQRTVPPVAPRAGQARPLR
jgi:hypothetical protein